MQAPDSPYPTLLLWDWDNTLVDALGRHHCCPEREPFTAFGKPLWSCGRIRAERVRVALRESFPVMFGDEWERARDIFYATLTKPAPGSRFPDAGRGRKRSRPGRLCLKVLFPTRPAPFCAVRSSTWVGKAISVLWSEPEMPRADKPDPAPIHFALQHFGRVPDRGGMVSGRHRARHAGRPRGRRYRGPCWRCGPRWGSCASGTASPLSPPRRALQGGSVLNGRASAPFRLELIRAQGTLARRHMR